MGSPEKVCVNVRGKKDHATTSGVLMIAVLLTWFSVCVCACARVRLCVVSVYVGLCLGGRLDGCTLL